MPPPAASPVWPKRADELLDQTRIDQAADAERADDQPDDRIAQVEPLPQVGADIGEGAEHEAVFEEREDDDRARPRIARAPRGCSR